MSEPDMYCWDEAAAGIVVTRPEVQALAAQLEIGREALMWAGIVHEMDEYPDRYEPADLALADNLRERSIRFREVSLYQAAAIYELEACVHSRWVQMQAAGGSENV